MSKEPVSDELFSVPAELPDEEAAAEEPEDAEAAEAAAPDEEAADPDEEPADPDALAAAPDTEAAATVPMTMVPRTEETLTAASDTESAWTDEEEPETEAGSGDALLPHPPAENARLQTSSDVRNLCAFFMNHTCLPERLSVFALFPFYANRHQLSNSVREGIRPAQKRQEKGSRC